MEHRPISNRQRQILCPATAGVVFYINGLDQTIAVKTTGIVDPKIVPFARNDHVVVAIITHFTGFSRLQRRDCTSNSKRITLALFAAKPSSHSTGFNPNGVHRFADCMCNFVLDLGRVLGRAVNQNVAIFTRQGEGRLTFKIKVLLPTH